MGKIAATKGKKEVASVTKLVMEPLVLLTKEVAAGEQTSMTTDQVEREVMEAPQTFVGG